MKALHHTPVLILPASSSFYPLGVINAFVLHFGPCWFVRQWGSFGLGVPDASSHALTPGGDLHFFFLESAGFYFNLRIAKPANILHVLEMMET